MPKVNRKRIISTSESDCEVNVNVDSASQTAEKRRKREQKYDILLSKLRDIEKEVRCNINFNNTSDSDEGRFILHSILPLHL